MPFDPAAMTKVESPTVIAYNIKNLTGFVVCSQSVLADKGDSCYYGVGYNSVIHTI